MATFHSSKIDEKFNLKKSEAAMNSAHSPTYEYKRDQNPNIHILADRVNNCALHFHNQIEVIAVQTSEQTVQINNCQTVLHAGEMAIADSFDVHAYTYCDAVSTVLIVPDSFLSEYKLYKQDMVLKTNFIRDRSIFDRCFPLLKQAADARNPLSQRGYVDLLLGQIVEHVGFIHAPSSEVKDMGLIREVLLYIEKNYNQDLSLQNIASIFSYSSCHFSRLFNNFLHCNIKDYINTVRLRKFFEMHEENPSIPLLDLILESGFSSVPTFYRLFTKKLGMSPLRYFNGEEVNADRSGISLELKGRQVPPPKKKK